jgi:hypothetical protein
MLELPANVLLATHPACSERRHYQPCRRSHERKLGDQTKDDADKEPREERSCGRSQTLLYNRRRPHSSLDGDTPDQAYFNSLPNPYGGLTPADAPLIDAEILFRQPGPALLSVRWVTHNRGLACAATFRRSETISSACSKARLDRQHRRCGEHRNGIERDRNSFAPCFFDAQT